MEKFEKDPRQYDLKVLRLAALGLTPQDRNKLCEKCGKVVSLNTMKAHHRHYRNSPNETADDLRLLCDDCHFQLHFRHKQGLLVPEDYDLVDPEWTWVKTINPEIKCPKCWVSNMYKGDILDKPLAKRNVERWHLIYTPPTEDYWLCSKFLCVGLRGANLEELNFDHYFHEQK